MSATRAVLSAVGNMAMQRALGGGQAHRAGLDDGVARDQRVITAAATAAQALPDRASFEDAFGTDLSGVRTRFGDDAARAALSPGAAEAATVGETILFAHPSPSRALIGHEVAHVLQQRTQGAGTSRRAAEAEARLVGPAAARGESVSISATAPAGEPQYQDPSADAGPTQAAASGAGGAPPSPSAAAPPADSTDTLGRIRKILSNTWVGPFDEYELEIAWESFGERLPEVASANWQLFLDSIDRGAELDDISAVQTTKQRFAEDVKSIARRHLSANRTMILEEKERLGLADAAPADEAAARERTNALWGIRTAAAIVLRAQEAQKRLRAIDVGYDWDVQDLPGGRMRSVKEIASFNPNQPPMMPPRGDEEPPMPAWKDVKSQYDRVTAVISGLASASPALYALVQGEGLEAAGTGSAEQASNAIRIAVDQVLHNIDSTEPKIDSGDLDYRDLAPIHQQLFAGATASSGILWSEQYARWAAQDVLSDHESTEFWIALGLGSLAAAAFLVAEFATLGSATFFLAAGVGVLATGTQAARSWEHYQDLSQASRTNVTDETALVSQGQASGALLTAILDTAFVFVDLYAPIARGVGAAAKAAERTAAREVLTAGEREIAERAAQETAELGGREAVRSGTAVGGRQARGRFMQFILGPENAPTQAEIQAFLDQAWVRLRGASGGKPRIVLDPALPSDVLGEFGILRVGGPEIGINTLPAGRGALAGTVYHEAWHARFAQMFPRVKNSPVGSVLTAYIDEWIAYTIGGAARVRHGATIADRLVGLAEMLTAGTSKYASLNGVEILPALVNDVVLALGFIASLYYATRPSTPQAPNDQGGTQPSAP